MILHKVYINYEVTGYILVAAETCEEAEKKANAQLEAPGWNPKAVLEPEWVTDTGMVLEGSTDAAGEVVV